MPNSAPVPSDPIAFIQDYIRGRRMYWTYHVNMRLARRSISRADVIAATDTLELIESYPDDKYLPSYLTLGSIRAGPLHILFATDVPGDNIRVITAYRPDPAEWDGDYKKRTKP